MADVDVLVVGGGPSGLTVAAEVARTGARVLLLEKREVAPIPRAGTVLPRPLELFDARGIAGQFISRTCAVNPHPFQTWHIWGGMHPVDWSARDSRFGFTLFLSQHESENILREWAVEVGVDVRFEAEMVGLTDLGDHVEVAWRAADGTAPGSPSSCAGSSTASRRPTPRNPAAIRPWACRRPTSSCYATTAPPCGSTSCSAPVRSSCWI